MRIRSPLAGVLSTLGLALVISSGANAQDTQNRAEYIFSYGPSASALFLESMTFPDEQPLQLDELNCSTTAKINGPLSCAERCEASPLCLLTFNGPAGLEAGDILRKEAETPANGASNASRIEELKQLFDSQ